jgi:hypothetical protein
MGRVVAAAVYSAGKKVTNITLDEGAAWAAKPGISSGSAWKSRRGAGQSATPVQPA